MKLLFYDPIDILGTGFVLGFITILIILLTAYMTGKKIPMLKKSALIIGTILIIIYTPPLKEISKIWLIGALLILAMMINSILANIYSIASNIYSKQIDQQKVRKVSQLMYIIAFIFGIGIIISGSDTVVTYTYYLTKQLIILTIGVWLAFRLLYQRPPSLPDVK